MADFQDVRAQRRTVARDELGLRGSATVEHKGPTALHLDDLRALDALARSRAARAWGSGALGDSDLADRIRSARRGGVPVRAGRRERAHDEESPRPKSMLLHDALHPAVQSQLCESARYTMCCVRAVVAFKGAATTAALDGVAK